jgi:methyl-accepting chemotaxis protein
MEVWAEKAAVADAAAQDLWGTTGNLAQAMGFTEDASFDLTGEIGNLAADLASFNDKDPAAVFSNLTKAVLTTEREGMKPLGIAISEAEVKTRALAIAQGAGRDVASKADRAMASLAIATEQAGKAVGDLDRTWDSEANQQKRIAKRFKDLKVIVGKGLIPVVDDFTDLLEDNSDAIEDVAEGISGLLGGLGEGVDLFKKLDDLEPDWLKKIEEHAGAVVNPLGQAWKAIQMLGDSTEDTERPVRRINEALSTTINAARDAAAAVEDAADVAADAALTWADLNAALETYVGNLVTMSETAFEIADTTGGDPGDIFEDLRRGGSQGRGGGNRASSAPLPPVTINMGVVGDPYEAARVVADLLSRSETMSGERLSRVSTP